MSRFVTVDGATYFSTPDRNIVDAATAHIQSSTGVWSAIHGSGIVQNTDIAPSFGDYVARCTANGGADSRGSVLGITGFVDVGPGFGGIAVAFGVDVACSVSGAYGQFFVSFANAADGGVGGTDSGWSQLTNGALKRLGATTTTPATAEKYYIGVCFSADATPATGLSSGDYGYWDSTLVASGSDSTFSPSLRIVGSLFEDKDPPAMPIGFASDGTPLTVGAGWAGDAYHYRRYDGADASAPLVAAFEAEDVPYVA